jgi:hypothetical protein
MKDKPSAAFKRTQGVMKFRRKSVARWHAWRMQGVGAKLSHSRNRSLHLGVEETTMLRRILLQ